MSLATTARPGPTSARWPVSSRRARPVIRAQATTTTTTASPYYDRLRGVDVLRATDGTSVALRETWAADRGEKALLVLSRSFGCPFCQATARELARDVLPKLNAAAAAAAGGEATTTAAAAAAAAAAATTAAAAAAAAAPRLVFVGIGTAERARDFAQRTNLPLDVLFADPDNAAYDALGLESSLAAAFLSPQTPLAIAKRAARPGGWGDLKAVLDGWEAWQPPRGVKQALNQGGAFLFDGRECVWSHRDAATAAHSEPGEMLERALALAAKGAGADCGCGEETTTTAAA